MGETTLGGQFKSLRDLVCEELRNRIIDGELPPGGRLVERDLAEELDVSRIVIREAIQQLVAENLVVLVARRGAQVASMDEQDVVDLFEVRLNLEVLAVRCAAERRTDDDLARLQRLIDAARRATADGDIRAASDLNLEFHFALADVSRNQVLASILQSLAGPVRRVFRIAQDTRPQYLISDHIEILDAIRTGDAERAGRLAYDHIEATREPALARMRSGSAPATTDRRTSPLR